MGQTFEIILLIGCLFDLFLDDHHEGSSAHKRDCGRGANKLCKTRNRCKAYYQGNHNKHCSFTTKSAEPDWRAGKGHKKGQILGSPAFDCQLHSQCLFSLGLDSDFCRNLADFLFLQFGLYSISVTSPQRCALHKPRRSSWVSPYYVSRLRPLPAAGTSRKSYAELIQTASTRWSAPSSGPQLAWVHA